MAPSSVGHLARQGGYCQMVLLFALIVYDHKMNDNLADAAHLETKRLHSVQADY